MPPATELAAVNEKRTKRFIVQFTMLPPSAGSVVN